MLESPQVKLLVLAQARQWLSAAERLDPIPEARATPKTRFQLADAIKQPKLAEYAPFGCDFEDAGARSPVISRLLVYAEIHNCNDHDYGAFSTPQQMMPYTYRQLQGWIIERRGLQQVNNAAEGSSRELVQTWRTRESWEPSTKAHGDNTEKKENVRQSSDSPGVTA